ncbi:MAG: TorF family putative porin [Gammaproteobacteria bacterium]|nr:TorF family putative porin [Gammaproteobacteria bacterium]NNJ50709.1 hypothetical protein [Gammaproteobacteria bacterium]
MKNSIVLATAVASILTSGVAAAELTANASITSNYIWRGITQTADQAAGQGGIDWGHDSGLYVGTWVSNVAFGADNSGNGYEMDVYAGFGGEVGGLGYDLGVASYQYPITPEFNFTEAYISGTMSIVTLGLWYTVDAASGNDGGVFDQGDMYVSGSLDFAAGKSDVSLYAGSYMFTNDGEPGVGEVDYVNYGASIGKDGFAFAVDKNDIDDGSTISNVRFTASYTMDFEL